MNADRFALRRDKLVQRLKATGTGALLVSDETNVRYLTGFTGDSSFLLFDGKHCIFISDGRYTTQIRQECPGLETYIRLPAELPHAAVANVVNRCGCRSLAVEASMSLGFAEKLKEGVKVLELRVSDGLVEELRQIKDAGEVAEIRRAIRLAERGFEVLRAELRGDLPETAVANNLEHSLREFGARGCSFPPIVAAGPRSALPHGRPSPELVSSGEFVLVDWGAVAPSGYVSDLTRVLAITKISPKLERVYGVVLKAQLAAIAAIRPGVRSRDVDAVARRVIDDAGFGKRFTHGLGHGIGLEVHEGPRLNAATETPLRPGMVVTVEPGVYIEGWGGVRIEDDVLVTRSGCEVLTSVPKELARIDG
jgi:Xaa-Pro aminopeptidase